MCVQKKKKIQHLEDFISNYLIHKQLLALFILDPPIFWGQILRVNPGSSSLKIKEYYLPKTVFQCWERS